jgi:hypothetical protein
MNVTTISDYIYDPLPPVSVQVSVMKEADEQSRRAIELLYDTIDKLKGGAFDGLA